MSAPETGRAPTLLDVASIAGVSHTTVSRFLREDPTVNPALAARIEAAVAELDYRPNILARSMRQGRSGLLAIVLPASTNTFSPMRMVSPALVTAHRAGFEVEIINVDGDAEARTKRVLELTDSRTVGGVLALAALSSDLPRRSRAGSPPVVEVPYYDDELRGAGVLLDVEPIVAFVERLAGLGHKKFFFVGGPDEHPSARVRRMAFEETVARLGLDSLGWSQGPWQAASGYDAVRSLGADSPVTALVCVNDELAAGAYRAAVEHGWSVPGRVSITGWDNNPLGAYLTPRLTTVHPDHELLGNAAMQRLLDAMNNVDSPPADYSTLHTIIWRDSVSEAHTFPSSDASTS